jgi:hypothetical protein
MIVWLGCYFITKIIRHCLQFIHDHCQHMHALFSGRNLPNVGYFKSVLSTTLKNDSDHIIVISIHYTVILREIDLIQLFKKM